MALMTRLKNFKTDPLPVDIANNLETLQFESALTEEEKGLLHLRNRTHAITVSACAQATFFVKILHEARQLKKQIKSPQKRTAKILQDREPRDPVRVGIIGCGRLGSQIAHCLITFGGVNPKDLKISTRRPETLEYLRNKGVECRYDNVMVASSCHVIFVCVLPSHVQTLAEEIKEHIPVATILYSLVTTYTPKRLKQLFVTNNIICMDYSWTEESEKNYWNHSVNVNTALENLATVEKTCPIGYKVSECVVLTNEKLVELMIFAFINMCTSLRLNKQDSLEILHIVVFDEITEDKLKVEDFVKNADNPTGMFPKFSLVQVADVTTSINKRMQSDALRKQFVKKYLNIFDAYVQQKAYGELYGQI